MLGKDGGAALFSDGENFVLMTDVQIMSRSFDKNFGSAWILLAGATTYLGQAVRGYWIPYIYM